MDLSPNQIIIIGGLAFLGAVAGGLISYILSLSPPLWLLWILVGLVAGAVIGAIIAGKR